MSYLSLLIGIGCGICWYSIYDDIKRRGEQRKHREHNGYAERNYTYSAIPDDDFIDLGQDNE